MKTRLVIAVVGLGLLELGCSSFCPPETVERGKKGDAQWCEAKGAEGVFLKVGPYKSWHSNGKVAQEGQYLGGKPTGRWVAYDKDGEKQWENTYDDKGALVGQGKYFSAGRDLVAEPDLGSAKSAALSFVVAMNVGDDEAVLRVLGNDYAKEAASDCELKKQMLRTGDQPCDPEQILSRLRRLHVFTRQFNLSAEGVHDETLKTANVEVEVTSHRGAKSTATVRFYKKDVVWRPAQIPPEMLLPSAFESMVLKEILDGHK